MKMIYGNPRPYWVDPSLSIACDGGYGNPSGHAFSSTTSYLSLWLIITDFDFFKDTVVGIALRIFLLILFIILILTIMLSRVYLGVHSVNQILYGASLGFAVYYIIFHIFSLHRFEGKNFLLVFRKKLYIIIFSVWYGLLLIIGFLIWGLVEIDNSEWEPVLTIKCPNIKLYRKFKNDGMYGFLTLFALIGGHFGLIFLSKISAFKFPNKEEEINHWYIGSCKANFYRVLLCLAFVIPIILIFVVPGDIGLGLVYTFKVSFPYLVVVFSIYGPLIICSIFLKIANMNILIVGNIPGLDIESNVINQDYGGEYKILENGIKSDDHINV
jgi:hypothetical protein